jgi:hypothetical protein
MEIRELFESEGKKRLAVVYGGRFQPFHIGHFHAYRSLCRRFGEDSVWVATSNKTNLDPKKGDVSPFTFKEKRELMIGFYKIPAEKIILCKNPAFSPKEVFTLYGDRIFPIYIAAVGKKDVERYEQSTFFEKLPTEFKLPKQKDELIDSLKPIKEGTGYYYQMPMQDEGISGTEARDQLLAASPKQKAGVFTKFFGHYDSTVCDLIMARLKEIQSKDFEEDEEEKADK